MEKNFNDDELQDIMSEIESLESGEHQPVSTAPVEGLEEIAELEISNDEQPQIKAVGSGNASEHHHEAGKNGAPSKTSINFQVEGNTTLDLQFLAGNKLVHCVMTKDFFEVELDTGLKFTLPLNESFKKSA